MGMGMAGNSDTSMGAPTAKNHGGVEMPVDTGGHSMLSGEWPIRVRKKLIRVRARFAVDSGTVATLEGPVPYDSGDVIVTGQAGERWPVRPEKFHASYRPVPPLRAGEDGDYDSLSVEAYAFRVRGPFEVRMENGGELRGSDGDWLIGHDDGSYGIVREDLFPALYEPVQISRDNTI